MLLKNQVTSLGLSKRLKELGVKQESFFWWYAHREMQTNKLIEWRIIQHNASSNESCSAFTVAELLNLLDEEVTIPKVENIADYLAEKICSKLMQK